MRPDRVLGAVGLALACVVLAGLVLNLAGGLTRLSWSVALAIGLLAWAGAALALRQRKRLGRGGRHGSPRAKRDVPRARPGAGRPPRSHATFARKFFQAPFRPAQTRGSHGAGAHACPGAANPLGQRAGEPAEAPAVRGLGGGLSLPAAGYLLLAAALAGGGVWLAVASVSWQRSPGFAQLWLVPGKGATATLGVRDNYPGRQEFRLVLRDGARPVASWDLALADGETWQRTVAVPAGGGLTATLDGPGRVLSVTS